MEKRAFSTFVGRASAAVACFICFGSSVLGQGVEPPLSPEIAPLAAKYKADLDASGKLEDQALTAARAPYVKLLATAEQQATSSGKLDELKAVMDETDAVKNGRKLDATPPPLLPRSLAAARNAYVRDSTKAERENQARTQQAAATYLRGLAFVETKARGGNQAALLEQVNAEKAKLTGRVPTPPAPPSIPAAPGAPGASKHENMVINGNFTEKEADGKPANWHLGGSGNGAVTADNTGSFLRMVNSDGKEGFFLQLIGRPANAKEVRVSVRLRAQGIKGGTYGLVVAQRNAGNGLIGRDLTCTTGTELRSWKEFTATVKLKPEATSFVLKCNMAGAIGTVDFTDVHAETR